MSNTTLVCILSETRASNISWPSFKTNVLEALNADLAICVGTPDNYDYSNPFWQHAAHHFTSREYEDWGEAFDLAQRQMVGVGAPLPDWRSLMSIAGNWLGGIKHELERPGSAAITIFFRWLLLSKLREADLLSRYDRFIVTRSDFIWECPHPPMEVLDKNFLWIPDGEHYGGIMDRHAVLSRSNVEGYLNLLGPIVLSPDLLKQDMRHKEEWNYEAYLQLQLKRAGYGDKIRFFPYIMYAARDATTSTRWSEGVWSDKHGYSIKYPTEYFLVSRYKKYFSNQQDWSDYFRSGQNDLALGRTLVTRDGEVAYLNNGRLSVKAFDLVAPKRYVLKIDVVKGALSPYFVDPEVDFGALFPQFSQLSIVNPQSAGAIKIKVSDNQFLSIDENKNIVASAEPADFRLS